MLSMVNNAKLKESNSKKDAFLVLFATFLEPRLYVTKSIIQNQYEEIFEVLFVMKGTYGIGYTLFNETFYAKQMGINRRRLIPINDYSCLVEYNSEFLYRAVNNLEGLAIKRKNWKNIMKHNLAKKMKCNILRNYISNIRNPV